MIPVTIMAPVIMTIPVITLYINEACTFIHVEAYIHVHVCACKARSALAHKTGLEVDPLNNFLYLMGLRTVNWCETSLDELKCERGLYLLSVFHCH